MLMRPRITMEVMTVTPKIAKKWIDSIVVNRPLRQKLVEKYARDMENGKWKLSGQSIIISASGELIDGQHRCHACIMTGLPFQTTVVFGVDDSAKTVIDGNEPRKAHDVLRYNGIPNVNKVAAAANVLLNIKECSLNKSNHSITEIVECVQRHPSLINSVSQAIVAKLVSHSMVSALHYIGAQLLDAKEDADAFLDVFKTGVPAYDGCPVHAYRERLLKDRSARISMSYWVKTASIVHVWNNFRVRKRMTKFQLPRELSLKVVGLDTSLI